MHLDEMDRSLHDALCVVKRVLESGAVVPGEKMCGGLLVCNAGINPAAKFTMPQCAMEPANPACFVPCAPKAARGPAWLV